MTRVARNRGALGAAGTEPRDGQAVRGIDKALGLEHSVSDPLLDTGEAIPIGGGNALTRPTHGGANVRRDTPSF